MDLEQGRESENLEDRRRMGPKKLAIGGGIGAIILALIGAYLGVDPQKLNQLFNAGGAQPGAEQGPPSAEDERSRKFYSTVLAFTEDVWSEQFQKVGKTYTPPKMVLFTDQVDTGGCGPPRRRSGRSTARRTGPSTSTPPSSTSWTKGWAAPGRSFRKPT
jgi:predicted metalloprotease